MRTSDDPFPAARSSAYAKSYDLRTAEAKDYPRTANRSQAMIGTTNTLPRWQRVLHWLMAACIIAMLFIGVGMVSTRQADLSDTGFDPQAARHRHSGAGADPPGAAPALRCAVAAGRLAGADEARGRRLALRAYMP